MIEKDCCRKTQAEGYHKADLKEMYKAALRDWVSTDRELRRRHEEFDQPSNLIPYPFAIK